MAGITNTRNIIFHLIHLYIQHYPTDHPFEQCPAPESKAQYRLRPEMHDATRSLPLGGGCTKIKIIPLLKTFIDLTIPSVSFTQLDTTYGSAKKQESTLSKHVTPTVQINLRRILREKVGSLHYTSRHK
jgi:hypothetical protein